MTKKETFDDEFISHVTHELRTPVTLIKGFSQVILEDEDMDEENKKDFIRIIYNEICRLSNMVDKLSHISKLDRKKILINKTHVEPVEFIKEILRKFRAQSEEKSISLQFNFCEPAGFVMLDPEKMTVVIEEILKDSFKVLSCNGKIEITIKFTAKNFIIEVKDNGKGIPSEEIPFIFDKFYKVSSRSEDSGTGLGLTLAAKIIKCHRGSIKVKSDEHKGTCFVITLPLS
ncbi:MAG: HAMP domain-containing sensor histidine kinase [Candidatus Eremiobacterota bacterium]